MEELLKCKNLSFSYENTSVIKNLSFSVNSGDYLCIVGENGSGKSTLTKGILGLKAPADGKIIKSGGLKANEIGYLPQQTPAQKDFPASVFEVVLSGRLNSRGMKPFYSKQDKRIAHDNIKRLGIEELLKRSYRDLSGGQQQRVLLARALCAGKKMLLLDEPVTGLDPIVTDEMYKLILELNRKENITIIMVSHDITSAVRYATHILHLNDDKSFFGTTKEYMKSPMGQYFFAEVS
ncbi:MAG: metal ABC transporter ATP-binding protein [Clostridia bacterium]|nr:metal ABC transporter ATP-binding protein [Clostridia bacterium]